MKVIQINCVYDTGSTGKIVHDIHKELDSYNFESLVLYGRGKKKFGKQIYKISSEIEAKVHSLLSKLFGVDFGYSPLATRKAIQIIKKERPDVVHLHCLNGHFINVYKLIKYLKNNNINTVLTLHAEIMHTAGCDHAYDCNKWKAECKDCPRIHGLISHLFRDDAKHCYSLMKEAFEDFNKLIIVSVSPWLMKRASQSPILKDKVHKVVFNGLDTKIFKPIYNDNVKKKYAPKGEKLILYVTPYFSMDKNDLKGGRFVIELAKRMLNQKVHFIVVGNHGKIEDIPENVSFIGRVDNQEDLAAFYSIADVTLLFSKRETFSMVTAESLCCGTPVLGFKAGAPEEICIKEFCSFLDYGNLDALEIELKKMLSEESECIREKIANLSNQKYSKQEMCNEYLKIYEELAYKK